MTTTRYVFVGFQMTLHVPTLLRRGMFTVKRHFDSYILV